MALIGADISAALAAGCTTARAVAAYALWHRPACALIAGLLAGHFIVPPLARPLRVGTSTAVAAVCIALLFWLECSPHAPAWCIPFLPVVAGVALGFLVWTRDDPYNWRDL